MVRGAHEVCRYWLQGNCKFGDRCKFRHNQPGVVVAKDIAKRAANSRMEGFRTLVDGAVKVTFRAGVVPTNIEFLLVSRPPFQIEAVETSLEVTWYQATRNLWFHFDSKQKAEQAAGILQHADPNAVPTRIDVKPSRDGKTWTVQVLNVTNAIESYTLLGILPGDAKPTATVSGDWSYTCETPTLDVVKQIVAKTSDRKIETARKLKCSNPLKYKAEFKFEGSLRLDRLARELSGHRVPEFGECKIFAQERVEVRLSFTNDHYLRHSRQLKSAANKIWDSHKVQVHIKDVNAGRIRIGDRMRRVELLLQAVDRKALASAKSDLDQVLIHEVAGPLTQEPKPLQQIHRIRLTKTKSYRDALVGGLKRATDMFGPDIVQMDDQSDPPALIVKGDTATLRKVQKCLNGDKLPESKMVECSICWQKSEAIVRISPCNHVACQDCFVQYCSMDIAVKSPIRCFQSECDKLIAMDQLRSALERHQLQRLLAEGLTSYFSRNPEEYSPCIGTDCVAFHRPSEVQGQHICPKCFTVVCSKCKVEFHFGETCNEYQARTSEQDRAFEEWMETEGAKHCKRCNAAVVKLEGCDNMECWFCKAHFCWRCMETFTTHQAVYEHLLSKHGGYFGDEEEQLEHMREIMEEDDLARAVRGEENDLVRGRAERGFLGHPGRPRHAEPIRPPLPIELPMARQVWNGDGLEEMAALMERQNARMRQQGGEGLFNAFLPPGRPFPPRPRGFDFLRPRPHLRDPVNIPPLPPPAAANVHGNEDAMGWRERLAELRARREAAEQAAWDEVAQEQWPAPELDGGEDRLW